MSNRKRAVAAAASEPADSSFSEDQIGEFKAAFEFFGANGDQLKKDDLRAIMGKMSLPTNADALNKMMQEADPAGLGYVDFTAFVTMMSKKLRKTDSESTVRNAFAVFDPKGNGYINSDDLYKSLTTMGDKLTESEVGDVFAVQGVDRDGNFYYGDFIKEMFGARGGAPQ